MVANGSMDVIDRPFLQKPISVIETAFNLFGFLPADGDRRWPFLAKYDETMQRVGFRAMNFANAWGATYLSEVPSYRSGFITTGSQENYLQLDRALDNLDAIPDVTGRYEASQDDYEADMRLSLTDRLTTDRGRPEIEATPCPEALYQIRLYYGQYLARVGFNVHEEDDASILSIVNIQGGHGMSDVITDFKAEFGISPFNMLVQRALSLAAVQDPAYDVRGMVNPTRGNSRLYWGVLNQEGVDMHHAHRKPGAASLGTA
jgi:hypothetical protein